MKRVLVALLALIAPPAWAHPHVYVDTGVEVIFDAQGRATALRVRWTYDDYYSLLLMGERGMDMDGDGQPTDAERAALQGFDMNWQPGFPGDTYALSGEVPLVLLPPEEATADYLDGRLSSTHLRRFEQPVDMDQPLVVQAYDPGFYTAYSIPYDTILTNAPQGCAAQTFTPDRDAADQRLLDALAEYGADQDAEVDFPAVGAEFADEVRVTCARP